MPPKELAKQILTTDKAMVIALREIYSYLAAVPPCPMDEDMAEMAGDLLREIENHLEKSQDAIMKTTDMLMMRF